MLLYMVKESLQAWLGEGSSDGEVILDYLDGPCIITKVHIRGKQGGRCQGRTEVRARDRETGKCHHVGFEDRLRGAS